MAGTGVPQWGSLVPECLITLDMLDMGVPGGAKDTHTSLCCYQDCQGSYGAGDMRGIPIAGSTPITVCIHIWGVEVPGTPAPGMLKVLGGSGGF